MNRNPIKSEYQLVVLGVDSGIRNTGLSVVALGNNGNYYCIGTGYIETKKQDKKALQQLRSNVDDFRRYKDIYLGLQKMYNALEVVPAISAVSVESYTVMGPIFDKKRNKAVMGNSAWKSAVVYGGILFWALCNDLYVSPFLPSDIKRRFGKLDKSKVGIQLALENEIYLFRNEIKKYAKTKQEHVSDATAHAVLLIEEIQKNKIFIGGI